MAAGCGRGEWQDDIQADRLAGAAKSLSQSPIVNQSKELTLHLMERLWMSMLEISEWLPKPKLVCASKWTKHDSERIELAVAPEMTERHPSE